MNRMFTKTHLLFSIVSALVIVAFGYSCSTGKGPRFVTAKQLEARIDLSQLTPLETKRLEEVMNNEVSPCGDDVTLAEALRNPEHCPLAPLASRFVIRQVMDDYSAEEISTAYLARYAALKGLEIPVNGSPRTGAEKPIVTIVVFTDFECPFCAKTAGTMHELLRRYPKEIAVVHKNYPLSSHKNAETAARAAYAAHKQGKFWEMHDVIFSALGSPLDRSRFDVMAVGLGLDLEQFQEDFASPAATAAIAADKKLAEQYGIGGTPAIFVNGRVIDEGLSGLNERIAEEFLRFIP